MFLLRPIQNSPNRIKPFKSFLYDPMNSILKFQPGVTFSDYIRDLIFYYVFSLFHFLGYYNIQVTGIKREDDVRFFFVFEENC